MKNTEETQPQPITGYPTDDEGDWVAQLAYVRSCHAFFADELTLPSRLGVRRRRLFVES